MKQILLGNEEWILYYNMEYKKSWVNQNKQTLSMPKADPYPKMYMILLEGSPLSAPCKEVIDSNK